MTDFVILCEDEEFPESNVRALENALQGFVKTDAPLAVEFIFVDGEEIRRLNRELRGKAIESGDFPFEIDEEGNLTLGSVAVCCERAKEQAEEYGHSYERELHYLLVHGIMHCLGYDHLTDEEQAEMREKEEFILAKLGITRK